MLIREKGTGFPIITEKHDKSIAQFQKLAQSGLLERKPNLHNVKKGLKRGERIYFLANLSEEATTRAAAKMKTWRPPQNTL